MPQPRLFLNQLILLTMFGLLTCLLIIIALVLSNYLLTMLPFINLPLFLMLPEFSVSKILLLTRANQGDHNVDKRKHATPVLTTS